MTKKEERGLTLQRDASSVLHQITVVELLCPPEERKPS